MLLHQFHITGLLLELNVNLPGCKFVLTDTTPVVSSFTNVSQVSSSPFLLSSQKIIPSHSKYDISNYLSYDIFSPSHLHFVSNLSLLKDPHTYNQAINEGPQID